MLRHQNISRAIKDVPVGETDCEIPAELPVPSELWKLMHVYYQSSVCTVCLCTHIITAESHREQVYNYNSMKLTSEWSRLKHQSRRVGRHALAR